MQALRNLLGGSAASGEVPSFQQVSEAFQAGAQQLLRGAGSAGEGPCHRTGRVYGDHYFNFSLHFEPRSEGGGLCQTGVLVASASSSTDANKPVPVKCIWKRRIGAHLIEIPGISGNMYHTSADDIGMDIVCHAEPVADPGLGQAYGVLGPFELDPITRMSLENLISSGASRFPVRHYRDQEDQRPRDLQIHVTQDCVKVVHPGAERGSHEVVAPYSADYPKVVIHPLDTLKFRLELSEQSDQIYHFVALSRTSRDLIALFIRCFHSRKYVATSFILSRLFQNPATPGAPLTSVQHEDFDIFALGDRLGKELDRTVGQLEVVEKVVRNATMEKSELQAQLRETICSYTEAIEKLHTQLACANGGAATALQLHLHDGKAQQQRLQMELSDLRQKVYQEEQLAPQGAKGAGGDQAAEAIKAEIADLRKQISALAGESAHNSQRDMTRAEELRRLRSDVERLNSEKEGLERCAGQADQDKADLIENFLYVKNRLDELQWASLESPACSPEHERQVAQLKESYSQVVDERNRLSVRVEALDRDREKQKQHRESALERVMNANARLLEERDRLHKEKARVSSLYQSTMNAMGAGPDAARAAKAAASSARGEGTVNAATLEAMKAELAQKSDLLAKREQEGESLRMRLRKLAMV